MTKATTVCAILFLVTSLSLALLSSQRSKSLLEQQKVLQKLQQMYQEDQEKAKQEGQAAVDETTKPENTQQPAS